MSFYQDKGLNMYFSLNLFLKQLAFSFVLWSFFFLFPCLPSSLESQNAASHVQETISLNHHQLLHPFSFGQQETFTITICSSLPSSLSRASTPFLDLPQQRTIILSPFDRDLEKLQHRLPSFSLTRAATFYVLLRSVAAVDVDLVAARLLRLLLLHFILFGCSLVAV